MLKRQVFVKVTPGLKVVPSGIVRSLTNAAESPVVLNCGVPWGVPLEGVTVRDWAVLVAAAAGVSVEVGST